VPTLVTLNDLEPRNGRYFALFHQFGSFGGQSVKVLEIRPTLSATKM